jgi:putative SOS response-associated peptidase YedK
MRFALVNKSFFWAILSVRYRTEYQVVTRWARVTKPKTKFCSSFSLMCGRSSLYEDPRELLEAYGLPPRLRDFVPHYNIAPSQNQWTIRRTSNGTLEVQALRWGLIPSWTNDPSVAARMINARAETLSEKPSYRDRIQTGRCLIIADGYYEWAKDRGTKTPYRFQMKSRKPFVFAGLWDRWEKGGSPIESCTIITTRAAPLASRIHDRMPVILGFDDSLNWIQQNLTSFEVLDLLQPYDKDDLEMYPVSRTVNNAANDTADCLQPLEPDALKPVDDLFSQQAGDFNSQ